MKNSFNRYVTDEEIADGVEPSGSQSITFQRKKGVDVTSKTATERAAAIAVEGDYSEFLGCTLLGSQDTLFTKCEHGYFRDCHIEGNTDYIFGQGDVIFQDCELKFAGYSDKAVGGYITAKTSTGKYLFYNCNVTAASGMNVGSGYFGRPWSGDADVAFVNTKLQYEDIITAAGWAKMSNNAPVNANFKEYNTTANAKSVNTSGRIANTVKTSGNGLDVNTYLNGWKPYYLSYTPSNPSPELSGSLISKLTVLDTSYQWAIDTQVGDSIYTDRDGVTYSDLPEWLIGSEAVVTPCDAKKIEGDLANLTAAEDITLVVALDTRVTTAPSWLSDWNAMSETVKSNKDVVYALYSKNIKSGETITLGTNGQTSGCVGYTVFAVRTSDMPSVTVGGDINTDGNFDAADVVMFQKWLLAVPGTEFANWEAGETVTLGANGQATGCMNYIILASDNVTSEVRGDLNMDGKFDIADVALLQKWLLAVPDTELANWKAGDLCEDGVLNYTDTTADMTKDNTYYVTTVYNGVETPTDGEFTLKAGSSVAGDKNNAGAAQIIPIKEGGTIHFVWIGDFNGDGAYDFLVDRSADDHQKLEAYLNDGTYLWTLDLGVNSENKNNISPGASTIDVGMWDGATVYDIDCDGTAEVMVRIADGATFGDGKTYSSNSGANGQAIAVINGMTGALETSVNLPTDYLSVGPMACMMEIGYLDGANTYPSLKLYWDGDLFSESYNDSKIEKWNYESQSVSRLATTWKITGCSSSDRDAPMFYGDILGDWREEIICTGYDYASLVIVSTNIPTDYRFNQLQAAKIRTVQMWKYLRLPEMIHRSSG